MYKPFLRITAEEIPPKNLLESSQWILCLSGSESRKSYSISTSQGPPTLENFPFWCFDLWPRNVSEISVYEKSDGYTYVKSFNSKVHLDCRIRLHSLQHRDVWISNFRWVIFVNVSYQLSLLFPKDSCLTSIWRRDKRSLRENEFEWLYVCIDA